MEHWIENLTASLYAHWKENVSGGIPTLYPHQELNTQEFSRWFALSVRNAVTLAGRRNGPQTTTFAVGVTCFGRKTLNAAALVEMEDAARAVLLRQTVSVHDHHASGENVIGWAQLREEQMTGHVAGRAAGRDSGVLAAFMRFTGRAESLA